MTFNIGKSDRAFRVILGLLICGLGFYFKSYWGFIGILPLATAGLRVCPAYLPFHLSTVKKGELK